MSRQCGANRFFVRDSFSGESNQATHDPGSAKSALCSPCGFKRHDQSIKEVRIYTFQGGNRATCHTTHWRHTTDARLAIDKYRATTTLALRTTPVLYGMTACAFTQGIKQCGLKRQLDGFSIERDRNGRRRIWRHGAV